jgi:hypothetical protein
MKQDAINRDHWLVESDRALAAQRALYEIHRRRF